MKGQKEEVLQFLTNNGTMTPWTAWEYLGITKLATRISELRSDGVAIGSEKVEVRARNGRKTTVCRYWLEDEKSASYIEHKIQETDKILAGDISKYMFNDLIIYRGRLSKELIKARAAK